MSNDQAMADQFWRTLKSDRTFMLGLVGIDRSHARPMTANVADDDPDSIWIFTSNETELARSLARTQSAAGHFASKDHDLFATFHGRLSPDPDPRRIDAFWNPFIAAWYPGGKTDPTLLLLRFDLDDVEIWRNEHSLLAGIRILLGKDPRASYQDKVAKVRF